MSTFWIRAKAQEESSCRWSTKDSPWEVTNSKVAGVETREIATGEETNSKEEAEVETREEIATGEETNSKEEEAGVETRDLNKVVIGVETKDLSKAVGAETKGLSKVDGEEIKDPSKDGGIKALTNKVQTKDGEITTDGDSYNFMKSRH